MNRKLTGAGLVLGGILLGAMLVLLFAGNGGEERAQEGANGEDEPLYWVAPMDPNYRRDEPGKSPMGMDLIPVYEEGPQEPGSVEISPEVVNNLGVRTARVELGRLNGQVRTVGYVEFNQHQRVNVDPRVEGWIEQLFVRAEGDPVERGEPLYSLYSPTLVNAQEELLLALRGGNASLIRSATERLRALRVPQSLIDQVREQRRVQQTVTINAPRSGVVETLEAREGAAVTPGSRILSIAPLDEVWVVGNVYERQLPLVQVGDPVSLQLDYLPGREWQGEVNYIYPTIDPETRTARVRMRFDNRDQALRPGMYAQLLIQGDPTEETLLIPRQALIRTGEANRVVMVRGEGRYKSVNVKVGRIVDDQVEILEGLEPGDRIVTSAQFLLDSESSKTSDFMRMESADEQAAGDEQQPVWVGAEVTDVMPGHRMVTLDHEPVEAWGWPAMTMNFTVDESVDMGHFEVGQQLQVQIAPGEDDGYVIQQVEGVESAAEGESSASELEPVWVEAEVTNVMPEHRMVTLNHAPVEAWGWPRMTMNFTVDESLEMGRFEVGRQLRVLMAPGRDDGDYVIQQVEEGADND